MHRFIKCIILFAVSVALLSNCATTSMRAPDQKPVITSKTDKTTLVIIRDTKFGGATVFWTYLDRKLIGETKGNTFFITEVEPGPHYLFVVTENTVGGTYQLRSGKNVLSSPGDYHGHVAYPVYRILSDDSGGSGSCDDPVPIPGV